MNRNLPPPNYGWGDDHPERVFRWIAAACGVLLAIFVALWLTSEPAEASNDVRCGPRAEMLARFKATYGQEPAAAEVASSAKVFELLVSPKGTWTVLATGTDGVSCMVGAGRGLVRRPRDVGT